MMPETQSGSRRVQTRADAMHEENEVKHEA